MKSLFFKKILMVPFAALFAALFLLSTSVVILMAFEAHVVNVTATIERPKLSCDALSIGYWRNHEGCAGGEGESVWTSEIREMTRNFSGMFYDISGEEICQALWVPDCPSGNNVPAKRCRATAMTLADELNLVSGRLDLDALIAGADDGNPAFDHLNLNYNSTVREALVRIEMIITNEYSTIQQLNDAAYVAERIYSFYEDENPEKPYCVMDPIVLPSGILQMPPFSQDLGVEDDDEGGQENNHGDERNGRKNDENDEGEDGDEDEDENENEEIGSNDTGGEQEAGAELEESPDDGSPIFGPFQQEESNDESDENATSSALEIITDDLPNATSSEG